MNTYIWQAGRLVIAVKARNLDRARARLLARNRLDISRAVWEPPTAVLIENGDMWYQVLSPSVQGGGTRKVDR